MKQFLLLTTAILMFAANGLRAQDVQLKKQQEAEAARIEAARAPSAMGATPAPAAVSPREQQMPQGAPRAEASHETIAAAQSGNAAFTPDDAKQWFLKVQAWIKESPDRLNLYNNEQRAMIQQQDYMTLYKQALLTATTRPQGTSTK